MSTGRRRSSLVDVDPLDASSFNDHDMVGGSQLPPVHVVRTRTRSGTTRSRSGTLINQALGRVEESTETVNKTQAIEEHPEESETESGEQKVQPYEGEEINKTPSTIKRSKRKQRKANVWKITLMFAKVYLLMFVLFIGILSIYWGSIYNRPNYYHKINYLVVLDEDLTSQDSTPLYSLTLKKFFENESLKQYGTFHIKNSTDFPNKNQVRNEVVKQVHDQHYWGAVYVPPNITSDYYHALATNSSFNRSIEFIYETGRNPQGVPSYIVGIMKSIEKQFIKVGSKAIVQNLLSKLDQNQLSTVLSSHSELLQPLWWEWTDHRPNPASIIITVVQVGLIYLLVLSFHQFNFASTTHEYILKNVHTKQYLLYHYTVSQLAYIILSFVYSLMTLAFQVKVTTTFGKAGFLVEWAFVYLTMAAMGGVNENAAIQIFARFKPVIGFWLVFFLVINVSPVFSPMVVMNGFYRYGYAMPLYNGNELLKIVFLDTYKGNIGRNIGVLLVWIVLMNVILPFNLRNARIYTRRINAKAKESMKKQ